MIWEVSSARVSRTIAILAVANQRSAQNFDPISLYFTSSSKWSDTQLQWWSKHETLSYTKRLRWWNLAAGRSMFSVWIVERKLTEGKNRQYSVREDIKVEDTNTVRGERERKRNLSCGTRKMVIKHDEEMAQNKMKVDKLLWVGGLEEGMGF